MSHFTIAVITKKRPTDKVLSKTMMPFHQFECTGYEEYILDIDTTTETIEEFEQDKTTMIKAPNGTLHDAYDPKFFRDPRPEEISEQTIGSGIISGISHHTQDWGDGKGHRAKVRYIPAGYEEIQEPTKNVKTIAKWLEDWRGEKIVPYGQKPDIKNEHKYGYTILNETGGIAKCVRRTNPNDKWDWYVIGGRWPNMLLHKNGEKVNFLQARDLDLEKMLLEERQAAAKQYDEFHEIVKGRKVPTWKEMEEAHKDIEDARDAYHEHPVISDLKKHRAYTWSSDYAMYLVPREEFLGRVSAFSTFAILKDGVWLEKGDGGWASTPEEDQAWVEQYKKTIEGLLPEDWICVVDCHI